MNGITIASINVINCQRCGLRAGCRAPVPPTVDVSGPNRILFIGEAPGAQEDRARAPFVGPAGGVLRSVIRKVGLDSYPISFTNTVQCYPNRTPLPGEIGACRTIRHDVIAAIEPAVIVLCGSVALSAFRPDLKITSSVGRPMYWGYGEEIDGRINHWHSPGVVLWPTLHPAAVLHSRSPDVRASLEGALYDLVFRMRGGWPAFRDTWPEECAVCGSPVDQYDAMGVAHCARHWQSQLSLGL